MIIRQNMTLKFFLVFGHLQFYLPFVFYVSHLLWINLNTRTKICYFDFTSAYKSFFLEEFILLVA